MNIVDKILFDPITKGLKMFSRGGANVFSTSPDGMSDELATKLGLKVYQAGTLYNNGISPTITGTNWTTVLGLFIPKMMNDGTWRCAFNIYGQQTNGSATKTISINGLTWKNHAAEFAVYTNQSSDNTSYSIVMVANPNTGNITTLWNSSNNLSWSACGELDLNSKPTWAY